MVADYQVGGDQGGVKIYLNPGALTPQCR